MLIRLMAVNVLAGAVPVVLEAILMAIDFVVLDPISSLYLSSVVERSTSYPKMHAVALLTVGQDT